MYNHHSNRGTNCTRWSSKHLSPRHMSHQNSINKNRKWRAYFESATDVDPHLCNDLSIWNRRPTNRICVQFTIKTLQKCERPICRHIYAIYYLDFRRLRFLISSSWNAEVAPRNERFDCHLRLCVIFETPFKNRCASTRKALHEFDLTTWWKKRLDAFDKLLVNNGRSMKLINISTRLFIVLSLRISIILFS